VYLSLAPVPEDLEKLYDEDYYAGRGGEGAFTYADDRAVPIVAALRANARLKRIEELRPPGRLLELGCSFGAFLMAAAARGWTVRGVDLSPYAVNHCREVGLDVTLGTLAGADLEPGSADVVYLSETVEHLPHPRATIAAAARVLAPGGLIVLGTANHASLARLLRGARWGYYLPGHLQYFSAASLSRLLAAEGLPVVRRRFGDDRSIADLREIRRATVGRAGILPTVKDVLVRISAFGFSAGAGMVVYGRKRA
jgi:SAM-dependent methyltransferase